MLKRVISLILSLVMILGMMPINITAAAEEIPAEEISVAETTAPIEEETVPTEAEPEETVPEETFAEIAGTIPEETAPVYLASSTGAGTCGATMFWSVDENGLLSIWGRGKMDDYTNTSSAPWYEYRSSIKEVSIADTVTSIGDLAFYSCSKISSITIPASVTSVGGRAFLDCYALKTIIFEGNAPSLTNAFYDISTIVYFPANNATWTEEIFQNYGGRIAWASTGEDTVVARGMWGAYNTNDIRWVLQKDGKLEFTGTGGMYQTNSAPAWNFFDSQIKKVVVNTGITSVCDDAFAGCANLTEVSLPASLTSIGDSAFSSCTAITSVVVPEGVKKIGEGAFASCSKLTDISLPNTLTSIGNYAFSYCTSLTEIDLPESLTEIEYGAFANCPGLKKVSIPKGVTYIDSYIVRECPNLETFELWYTVDLIDYDAFWNCPALRTIIFHGTPAQWNAVEKDSTVTSVLNSQNVYIQYVDPCVDGHTEVIDKKVAATCTANGKTEGKHCSVCGEVLVAQEVIPAGHDLVNDICQRCGIITGTCGTNLTWTLDDEGKLTVSGEGFATWSGNAPWYDYRDSVKTVVLGNGVTGIVSNAFSRYGNLKCVQLSDTVEYIGPYAFAWCESLTNVTMGSAVTEIGEAAFRNCGSLTYITIPATVRSIGMNAFAYCEKLSGITVDEANTYYSSDENGVLFNEAKTRLLNCPGALTGTYTIPDSVTEIATCAFSACVNLTGVEIPDSVRVIESYAFDGCTGLTEIAIPASVTTLGTKTFDHCAGLQKICFEGNAPKHFAGNKVVDLFGNTTATVYYPADDATWTEAVRQNYGGTITWKPYCVGEHTEVTDKAVEATCTTDGKTEGKHCSACGEVLVAQEVIPGGHTVENGICTRCKGYGTCGENLTWTLDAEGTLTISGEGAMHDYMVYSNEAPWVEFREAVKAVVFEPGVTGVGAYAFNNHGSLASVTIPDSVTDIGDHAFLNCDSLTGIEIPASVTEIKNAVFFDCDSLDNVVIPDSVVSIGVDAFYHCSGMTNLTVGNSVATIEDAAFGYCTSLTEIVLPDSVVSIGSGVLRGCGKLEAITVPFIGDSEKTSADSSQYPFGYLFGTGSYEGGEATNQFYYDDPAADSRTNQIFYIPASLKTVTVTGGEILLGAFSNCINLTEIVLPEELTAIGVQAFDSCSSLKSMSIPKTVTDIGEGAFRDCVSLKAVILPAGLKAIEKETFYNCNSLARITIPNAVTAIGEYAFYCCRNLTDVTFGNGVTEIGYRAFYGCESIASLNLGAAVVSIGEAAFESCTGLQTVTFPDGLETIGSYAFCDCRILMDVVIPETVTAIGDFAFRSCKTLNKFFFEGNASQIAEYSFDNVTAKAYYPAVDETWTEEVRQNHGGNITWIAYYEGDCGENLRWLYSEDGYLTISGSGAMDNYATATECPWYVHRAGVQYLTVENGVTTIGDRAFYSCTALTEVSIGNTVTSIGSYAFRGCSALESVTIPASVTEIKASAFRACSALAEVTFKGDAPAVGSYAFNECAANLTVNCYEGKTGFDAAPWTDMNVVVNHVGQWIVDKKATCTTDGSRHIYCSYCQETITETIIGKHNYVEGICSVCKEVELIDSGRYSGMTWKLDVFGTLTISGNTSMQSSPWRTNHADKILRVVIEEGISNICDSAFKVCSSLTEIVIPESVTSIGLSAFQDCSSLTEIVIPESVTSIGDSAFSGCSSLTEIVIPESVTSIGFSAFGYCTSLTEIVIPESVTVIDNGAFFGCSSLTEIMIPESVTSIGCSTFYGCSNLTRVVIPDSVTSIGSSAFSDCSGLTEIVIPDSVTSIDDAVFYGCSNLTNVVIGNSVTSIGDSAFYNSGLTEIVIPDSVTSIGDSAFYNSGLTEIVIPDSVTGIGQHAFGYCDSLTDVVIGDVVTSIDDAVFYGCNSLTNVVIGNSVTSIGDSAFYNSGLTEIVIPDSVTSIGDCVFECCYDLKEITFKGGAPSFGENVFSDVYATAYYPFENETWTSDVMQDYGGNITWVADCTNDHVEVIDEAVEATCTTDGKTEGKHCSVCGEVLVEQTVIPAKGHSVVEVPAVEPTINEEGNIAHFICEVCGKLFADAEGVTELKPEDVVLDKLPNGASINGNYYGTVEEALAAAKPGDVVKLCKDIAVDMAIVNEGVTLDLNGYTLTADYFVAFNGANVEDNSDDNTGLLKVPANRVMISKSNAQLPIWNGEGYVFSKVTYRKALVAHNADMVKFAFLPQFQSVATELLKDGFEDNKVTVEVRVSWETIQGREYRNLVFNNKQVALGISSGGAFILTFSGFSQLNLTTDVAIEAVVYSETGVSKVSDAIYVDVTPDEA